MLTISARYAHSLFEKAKEKNLLTKVLEELSSFIDILEKNKEIAHLWYSLSVSLNDKEKVLLNRLNFSEITKNFLKLILLKKRQKLISKIFYYYKALYNKYNNILEIEIKVPFKIAINQLNNIIKVLEEKTKSKIEIKKIIVDPEIIGGLIVISNDTIIDLSLKKDLERLLKNFKEIVNEKINSLGGEI